MSRKLLVLGMTLMLLVGCKKPDPPAEPAAEKTVKDVRVVLILNSKFELDMELIKKSPCPLRVEHSIEFGNLRDALLAANASFAVTFFKNGEPHEIPAQVRDGPYYSYHYDHRPDAERQHLVVFRSNTKLPFGTKFADIRVLGEIEAKGFDEIKMVSGEVLKAESKYEYKVYEAKAILP
ncbi:MAG: hypothetical protein HY289_02805 [Planctomycetes bacterium]|nr:hypothetical protein [Planctomycetota bacterium]